MGRQASEQVIPFPFSRDAASKSSFCPSILHVADFDAHAHCASDFVPAVGEAPTQP